MPVAGLCRRRDVDAHGLDQRLLREPIELGRHREREQQRLPRLGQQLEELAEIGREAERHHAVGFLEHEDLDVREVQAAARVQLEQPARASRPAG